MLFETLLLLLDYVLLPGKLEMIRVEWIRLLRMRRDYTATRVE